MTYSIRPVQAGEWREVRALRLDALRDPAAPLAFLDTYEAAVVRPESYWWERTESTAEGSATGRQMVAVAPDGRWVGSVTALLERPGQEVLFGEVPEVDQAHLIGVYLRPEARGGGVAEKLLGAAVDWAWSLREPVVRRARLYVHERNARAVGLYRKAAFLPSGRNLPVKGEPGVVEQEHEMWRPDGRGDGEGPLGG
ncbi:GNAT family N-acetyltransferase [Streptomyces somaliensis]|uniref:GNAT family N-acetyltransferase n=1 Tax=Streptomyces somaliensis TaxID=78355 RepID=UPI0020CEC975|nr:GNAT family N-acetyltransferase [Streptomyces somaliensis]MCP9944374.1 GNAT family N-acetyltransferase [Streptomyces somaliensis]MCP9962392.1 GNAT family N-acetyltransferase [Streptomyces somaliensis]MCP9975208.1 GNAT family N-acetyltransferase [Streptomyces somaliensis]